MRCTIPAIVLTSVAVASQAMNLRHDDEQNHNEQNKLQLIQQKAENNYDKSGTIKRSLSFSDEHELYQILRPFGSISNVKEPPEKDF
eukprot:10941103-Ditylum_brightwellii.AAC.1